MAAATTAKVSDPWTLDTQHDDMIHDVCVDYYSTKLATCSSDKSIRVFELDSATSSQRQIATLTGHDGPVWQVSWAHPAAGSLLASCSYDGKVIIWQEYNGQYSEIYRYSQHTSSVNSVAWGPHEYGLILACGSSDGRVSILMHNAQENNWHEEMIDAHAIGCNAVSWAPMINANLLSMNGSVNPMPSNGFALRLATGGCDHLVKIWRWEEKWILEKTLEGHEDWVRDVAWAPNVGLPIQYLATCSQDKTVLVWKEENGEWNKTVLKEDKFSDVVWKVSWSPSGTILAVSSGDNKITVWRENPDSTWRCISDLQEAVPQSHSQPPSHHQQQQQSQVQSQPQQQPQQQQPQQPHQYGPVGNQQQAPYGQYGSQSGPQAQQQYQTQAAATPPQPSRGYSMGNTGYGTTPPVPQATAALGGSRPPVPPPAGGPPLPSYGQPPQPNQQQLGQYGQSMTPQPQAQGYGGYGQQPQPQSGPPQAYGTPPGPPQPGAPVAGRQMVAPPTNPLGGAPPGPGNQGAGHLPQQALPPAMTGAAQQQYGGSQYNSRQGSAVLAPVAPGNQPGSVPMTGAAQGPPQGPPKSFSRPVGYH